MEQPDKKGDADIPRGTGFFMPQTGAIPQKSNSFHSSSRPIFQRHRNSSFSIGKHAASGSLGNGPVSGSLFGQSVTCQEVTCGAGSTLLQLQDGTQTLTSTQLPISQYSGRDGMRCSAVSVAGDCQVPSSVLPASTAQLLQETFWQPGATLQEPAKAMAIEARANVPTTSLKPSSWCMGSTAEVIPMSSSAGRVSRGQLSTVSPAFCSPLVDLRQQLELLQLQQGGWQPLHAAASAADGPCHQLPAEGISSICRPQSCYSQLAFDTNNSGSHYSFSTQTVDCGVPSNGGLGTSSNLAIAHCNGEVGLQSVLSQDSASSAAITGRLSPNVMQLSQCAAGAAGAGPMAAAATQHAPSDADELMHIDTELQRLLYLQQQLQVGRQSTMPLDALVSQQMPVLGSGNSSHNSELSCLTVPSPNDALLASRFTEDAPLQGEPLRIQAQQKLQQLLLIQQMERELQQELLSMLPSSA